MENFKHCIECGETIIRKADVCVKCGCSQLSNEINYCKECGGKVNPKAIICVNCGCSTRKVNNNIKSKNRYVAAILAFFLGGLGIHEFYIDNKGKGIMLLLFCLVGGVITYGISSAICWIIALVDMIKFLMMTDEEFSNRYNSGENIFV